MTLAHPQRSKAPWAAAALLLAGLAAGPAAQAGVSAGGWARSSQVSDTVTNNGNSTWTYAYTVRNTSNFTESGPDSRPILVDWELPWFGDAGISLDSIRSPRNWTFSIETIGSPNAATGWAGVADWQDPSDPWYAGSSSPYTTATQVLHWYNVCWVQQQAQTVTAQSLAVVAECEGQFDNAVFPDEELDGFFFDAAFSPTSAPYQASWAFQPVRTGDPAFPLGALPNSPAVQGNRVDEPALPVLLMLAGVAAVGLRRLRKSR